MADRSRWLADDFDEVPGDRVPPDTPDPPDTPVWERKYPRGRPGRYPRLERFVLRASLVVVVAFVAFAAFDFWRNNTGERGRLNREREYWKDRDVIESYERHEYGRFLSRYQKEFGKDP